MGLYTRRQTRLHVKANMFALYLVPDVYCTCTYMYMYVPLVSTDGGLTFLDNLLANWFFSPNFLEAINFGSEEWLGGGTVHYLE